MLTATGMGKTWKGQVRGRRELSLEHAEWLDTRQPGLEMQAAGQNQATSWMPGLEGGRSAGTSGKVDPVYETLRYGTSLALMNRSSFSSTSESPTRSLVMLGVREESGGEGHLSVTVGPGTEPTPLPVPRVRGMN